MVMMRAEYICGEVERKLICMSWCGHCVQIILRHGGGRRWKRTGRSSRRGEVPVLWFRQPWTCEEDYDTGASSRSFSVIKVIENSHGL